MAWCEYCDTEREGTVCPVCGRALLQEIRPEALEEACPEWGTASSSPLLERWPKGPDGEPEEAVLLCTESDFAGYAGVCCSILEAAGIPYLPRRSGVGQLGLIYGGYSILGVKLYVPRSMLEEARNRLHRAEERSAGLENQ